jgi:hypothetical protein
MGLPNRHVLIRVAALAGAVALVVAVASRASAGPVDWSTYLFSNAHGSYNSAATTITSANE